MKKFIKNLRIVKNIRNYFRTKNILSNSGGQIKLSTPPGKLIYEFIKNNEINNVLEIGTWNGLGSTLVIHDALSTKNKTFTLTSLETDKIAFKNAKKNLKDKVGINLKLGRIVEIDELPNPDSIDFRKYNLNLKILNGFIKILEDTKNKEYSRRFNNNYDFILFDGGEFSTFAEFKKLYKKTSYFCLDDLNAYKQYEVLEYIKNFPDKFELIDVVEDLEYIKL